MNLPWLAPKVLRARGWFVHMSVHAKFGLMGLLVAVPLCLLAGFVVADGHHEAQFAQARAESLERAGRVRDLMEALALHRGLTASVLAGAGNLSGSLADQRSRVQDALARVLDMLPAAKTGPDLPSRQWLSHNVRSLLAEPAEPPDPRHNFERHNQVIDQLVVMLVRTNYRGSTTDALQQAGAYELAFVTLPRLVESVGRVRGWGSAVLQRRRFEPVDTSMHLLMTGALTQQLELVRADALPLDELERALGQQQGPQATAVSQLKVALNDVEAFAHRSTSLVQARQGNAGLAEQHFADGTRAIEQLLASLRAITTHLQMDTQQRRQSAETFQALAAGALGTMLLALALLYRQFSHSTVRRLRQLAQASKRLANGEFGERVAVDGNDEISHLAAALDTMRQRLRQAVDDSATALARQAAERTRTEFLAGWSHDLRTPLSAVLGFARVLREGGSPAEAGDGRHDQGNALSPAQRADLARIETAAEHLLALVDDVLAISSAEWREAELRRQPLSVAALLRSAADLLHTQAQARGIRVQQQVPPDLPPVLADRTRLLQVLANLVGNAIKFNRDLGWVTLRAAVDTGKMRIDVVDGGPGIEPELLPRLFAPFERLNAQRRGVPGSGLGLVTAKRMVEAMQGRIAVNIGQGQGTTFSVWLPLGSAEHVTAAQTMHDPDPAKAATPQALPEPLPPAALPDSAIPPQGRSGLRLRGRLAYVEDNATNVELLRAMLALRSDIALTVFGDGAAALANNEAFDLWVLDHQLPDTDGIALLAALRQQRGQNLPAVLFTADVQPQRREAALAAGFAECWNKPLSLDLLETSLLRLWPH